MEQGGKNLGNDEYTASGNSKQCGKGWVLTCTSVYSTPLERIFSAKQFDI